MADPTPPISRVSLARFRETIIDHRSTLHDALTAINAASTGMCLVVSDDVLAGVLTDGDIRRALLDGAQTSASVMDYLATDPVVAMAEDPIADVAALMVARRVPLVPIIDNDRRPLGLYAYRDLVDQDEVDAVAVIMAGGRGLRMGELTAQTPKPMLPVAGRPILERIINRLVSQGLRRIAISVNYQADIIIEHFGDGAQFGCEIHYLKESTGNPLGTAGSLSLLAQSTLRISDPVLVMNGDVLADIDVQDLLAHHARSRAALTVCTAKYDHTVPFGVVRADDGVISEVVEKPVVTWQVNAGVYALSPSTLDRVPTDTFHQMTDLIEAVNGDGQRVASYLIPGFWFDIGEPQQIEHVEGAAVIASE